ncbi:hypothetical protein PAESOLCIP111_00298 [Paenibacillus solanacearum]|uniref:Uncharacterized protein n=1 Tax=Paenibacillus solanacearum TaxID=2048548 RepID=A0A916JSG8_9BACL|nr:hypothetical protein [Paenibacillus solanacearum]CAG7599277.1 hypothetical protein PAESOLCIP111_00298 [Paenibacillus solanacearum]
MSISAFIPEPANDAERQFHVPVAAEAFFAECWEPPAEALGLKWVPLFSTGIEIEKQDLPEVLDELNRLKEWALEQAGGERMEKLLSRIQMLLTALPQMLQRDGAVVYIG